jgi:hypothetical protein
VDVCAHARATPLAVHIFDRAAGLNRIRGNARKVGAGAHVRITCEHYPSTPQIDVIAGFANENR